MDDSVIRAMQKWPHVPNVFGWLKLDRRGNWLVKTRASSAGEPVFGRITNRAVTEFIGRNYAHDESGRWFFQNGPQRVYVALEYTPLVYRLRADGHSLEAHTGATPASIRRAWVDDLGMLLFDTDLGPGVALDRDLPALLARIVAPDGDPASEDSLEALASGAPAGMAIDLGGPVPLAAIAAAEVPAVLGFDPAPKPPPGQPDC
jgi:hypothetical protein